MRTLRQLWAAFSFVSVFFANFLAIIFIPENRAQHILPLYAIASGVASFLLLYLFSRYVFKNRDILLTVGSLAFAFAMFSVLELPAASVLLVSLWAVSQLLYDYWSTQAASERSELLRLLYLAASVAFFVLLPFEGAILMRGALIMLVIAVYPGGGGAKKLKVSRVFEFFVVTHVVYYGSLMVVTAAAPKEFVKVLYLSTQIFSQLALRVIDFKMRDATSISDKSVFRFLFAMTIASIVCAPILYAEMGNIVISALYPLLGVSYSIVYWRAVAGD